MAGKTAVLAVRIISDADTKGFSKAEAAQSKWERRNGRAKKVAGAVAVGIGAIGVAAFKQASQLQQASGAVESVFGRQSGKVKQLARDAAQSVGLARSEYSDLAAVLGSQLGNLGVSQDKLVGTTDDLIKLGGDLAATYGGSTSDAVSALSALMRGEADPIERYGVSIKDADVQARLAAKGMSGLTGAAKKEAETRAKLELLNEQTAKAQGQRSREANTAATRQERALAQLKNTGASLGTILLAIVASLASKLEAAAGFVERNKTATLILIGVVAGLAAAVYAVNGALAVYRTGLVVARGAQIAFNLAMAANPIGLVIAAAALLVAGFVLLYKRSERFRSIVQAVGRAGRTAIGWVVDKSRELVGWIKDKVPAAFARGRELAVRALNLILTPQRAIVTAARDAVGWAKDKLGQAFTRAKELGVKALEKLLAPVEGLRSLIEKVVGWIKRIRFPKPPKWLSSLAGGVVGAVGARTAGGSASVMAATSSPSLMRTTSAAATTSSSARSGDAGLMDLLGALGLQVDVNVNSDVLDDLIDVRVTQLLRSSSTASRAGAY